MNNAFWFLRNYIKTRSNYSDISQSSHRGMKPGPKALLCDLHHSFNLVRDILHTIRRIGGSHIVLTAFACTKHTNICLTDLITLAEEPSRRTYSCSSIRLCSASPVHHNKTYVANIRFAFQFEFIFVFCCWCFILYIVYFVRIYKFVRWEASSETSSWYHAHQHLKYTTRRHSSCIVFARA